MRLSPGMRDNLARQKEQGKSPEAQASGAEPKSLHLIMAELENDKKVLKGFQRIEDKIEHKREVLVPKYRQKVEEYLESEEKFDNPLFAQMIIWLFDIEDLETAIDWCDQAIELGLDTPANFKRPFSVFCADEVLAWSEKMSANGHSIEPFFSDTFEKVREKWRLNEKLTAKYYKFAGLLLLRDEEGKVKASAVGDIATLEKAQALLTEASNQNPKAGVASHIDRIEQRLRALKEGANL